MATSVTATSEPFSPTTATVSQPSGTASAGATAGSQIGVQESYSSGPAGGASGTSGGTTTQTLSCSSCCTPPVKYLAPWFGGPYTAGLCPAAVDNSAPVTLTATFTLSGYGGYSLADLCLPTSASVDVISDDPIRPGNLYLVTPASSCSSVSPPTTRFNIKAQLASPYDWIFSLASGTSATNLQVGFFGCNCSTSFNLNFNAGTIFLNWQPMTLSSSNCTPFSITYTGGTIWQGTTRKGSFDVTFTV